MHLQQPDREAARRVLAGRHPGAQVPRDDVRHVRRNPGLERDVGVQAVGGIGDLRQVGEAQALHALGGDGKQTGLQQADRQPDALGAPGEPVGDVGLAALDMQARHGDRRGERPAATLGQAGADHPAMRPAVRRPGQEALLEPLGGPAPIQRVPGQQHQHEHNDPQPDAAATPPARLPEPFIPTLRNRRSRNSRPG